MTDAQKNGSLDRELALARKDHANGEHEDPWANSRYCEECFNDLELQVYAIVQRAQNGRKTNGGDAD